MGVYEIYLSKKNITNSDWDIFINTIISYTSYFKRFSIIVCIKNNLIRYFIKGSFNLPPTINNLDTFLLKEYSDIMIPKYKYNKLSIINISDNITGLINKYRIKNKGRLFFLEIKFIKIKDDKYKSFCSYYLKHRGIIYKYNALFSIPINILGVDFSLNKRFFYKSCPKYLEIEKILHLLNSDSCGSLLKIDTFPYLRGDFYLRQNSFNFDKHSLILGSSGTGKSKFISLFINNIYKNKNLRNNYSFVVIDPHASLEEDIGGIGRVFDFKVLEDSINLFNNSGDINSLSEELISLFKSLIKDEYNSRLERVLRHSVILLLINNCFNFINLRKLLLDLDYRNNLIKNSNDLPNSITNFFLTDFNELKSRSYNEAISPIISFLDEMELIPVFNNDNYSLDLIDSLNNNFLTLFSLDRTCIGDKVTKTISGLIMNNLFNIIQKRIINKHIIFIVDEVSVVESPILCRFLSEARKYNLSLILAGQYFSQVSSDLQNSIFANCINYYIFRVSRMDAEVLINNLNIKLIDGDKDKKIQLLSDMANRSCIVRIQDRDKLLPAFKATTMDYKSIPRIKKIYKKEIIKNTVQNNHISFSIDSNISLNSLMKSNSTSRKVVKE